jgi:hypothetical protein
MGFSLSYPPDLEVMDLSGASPQPGVSERVLDFRAPGDPSRGFSISISSNPEGFSPSDWALEFTACVPDSLEAGSVGNDPAVFCTAAATVIPNPAVLIEHQGRIYYIGSLLSDEEFGSVLNSLRL